jgi:hypothetical protein
MALVRHLVSEIHLLGYIKPLPESKSAAAFQF